jgi:hypothetical protein
MEAFMKRVIACTAIVCALLLFLVGPCLAAPVGRLVQVQGRVDVLKAGKNIVTPVSLGDAVDVGDVYRAKSASAAEIQFTNGNSLKIGPSSRVEIKEYTMEGEKSSASVRLHRGRVQAVAGDDFLKKAASVIEGSKFEVETPNAVAGIRGTSMVVFYERGVGGTLFLEGHGYLYSLDIPGQIIPIQAGYISFVMGRSVMPTLPRKATPAELRSQINIVVHAKTHESKEATGETPQDFFVGTTTARAVATVDVPKDKPAPTTVPAPKTTPQEQNPIPTPPAPYVPPIEVATAHLSGSLIEGGSQNYDFVNVYMDVSMYRQTSGGNFTVWKSGSVRGDYKFGEYINPSNITDPSNYVVLTDAGNMEVNFQFLTWTGGKWDAGINGTLKGKASGTYNGQESGTLEGAGDGTVETIIQAAQGAVKRLLTANKGPSSASSVPGAGLTRLAKILNSAQVKGLMVRDMQKLTRGRVVAH